MRELHYLTIEELSDRIGSRAVSPVEATQAQLDRISAIDPDLHSYVHVMADTAIAEAEEAEAAILAGNRRGPLHGVPLAVKDLFWTKNAPTSAGMAIHRDFFATHDGTAVRRLREAGAVILGKLAMTEGAYSDYHPLAIPPINPWNLSYWTGISSSGPGVAIAAGMCHGALASDTGGSIRWPAAANGVTGLKPTWGRVSRYGVFELAASLDHIGTMARNAKDCGLMLQAIAGPDPFDLTALQSDFALDASNDLRGVRIGIDLAWNSDGIDTEVQRIVTDATDVFRALGAHVVEVRAPSVDEAIADWPLNCSIEAAVAHRQTYPSCHSEYGPVLASVIDAGLGVSGVDYQKILLRRMALRGAFNALFAEVDLLLTPVHPFTPLTLATIATLGDQPQLIAGLQRFTCPFDMTGGPTITLPGGFDHNRMPIGFQLAGAHLCEALLVRAGVAFQDATNWHRCHPSDDRLSRIGRE
jgi:amidase